MPRRQYTTPLLIEGETVSVLQRVGYDEREIIDEGRLQSMLFEHPRLLPAHEVEPVFDELIPVCREMPTRVGNVDLFYVTARGSLALVETKLWRNPEARRTVVAQIIDYVKDMAGWTYVDLINAVKRTRGNDSDDPLVDLVRDASGDLDAGEFHDQVARNLRLGRVLLLIVGDGIREDVEEMADFLQRTPQLGYTIGLVEIGLFRPPDDGSDLFFVQPRIVARTREVTRALVTIRNRAAEAVEVDVTLPDSGNSRISSRTAITESEFFDSVTENEGSEATDLARWVLDQADEYGWRVDWMDAGPVFKVETEAGGDFTLFQLHRDGRLSEMSRFADKCEGQGLPESVWRAYFDEVAALVPGASTRDFQAKKNVYHSVTTGPRLTKDAIRLGQLTGPKEAWLDVVARAVDRLIAALTKKQR